MCQQTGCGHGQPFHHHSQEHLHHPHGCCHTFGPRMRRFPTKEEIIPRLEEYLKQLNLEAKGVEERIAELKKEA